MTDLPSNSFFQSRFTCRCRDRACLTQSLIGFWNVMQTQGSGAIEKMQHDTKYVFVSSPRTHCSELRRLHEQRGSSSPERITDVLKLSSWKNIDSSRHAYFDSVGKRFPHSRRGLDTPSMVLDKKPDTLKQERDAHRTLTISSSRHNDLPLRRSWEGGSGENEGNRRRMPMAFKYGDVLVDQRLSLHIIRDLASLVSLSSDLCFGASLCTAK